MKVMSPNSQVQDKSITLFLRSIRQNKKFDIFNVGIKYKKSSAFGILINYRFYWGTSKFSTVCIIRIIGFSILFVFFTRSLRIDMWLSVILNSVFPPTPTSLHEFSYFFLQLLKLIYFVFNGIPLVIQYTQCLNFDKISSSL